MSHLVPTDKSASIEACRLQALDLLFAHFTFKMAGATQGAIALTSCRTLHDLQEGLIP